MVVSLKPTTANSLPPLPRCSPRTERSLRWVFRQTQTDLLHTSILFHWPKKPSRAWSTVRICLRLLSYVSHGYGRPRLTLGVTCMAGTVILSAPSFTRRTDTSAASAPLYHTKMATLLNRPEATLEAFCHVLEIILLQLQAHMHWKLTF